MVSPYDYLYPGGVSEHVHCLSATLRVMGHEVTVLAPSSEPVPDQEAHRVVRMGRSLPVPGNGSVARIGLSMSLGPRVHRILDSNRFDVVHYHEPLLPTVSTTVLHRHRGANVGTFHAYAPRSRDYQLGRPWLMPYFRRLHSCIAVSLSARDHVRRYFPGDYHVIPNGVDTTRFSPSQAAVPGAGGTGCTRCCTSAASTSERACTRSLTPSPSFERHAAMCVS
jgi:phosphatidylinositol alpha-mannosyltransferase